MPEKEVEQLLGRFYTRTEDAFSDSTLSPIPVVPGHAIWPAHRAAARNADTLNTGNLPLRPAP